MNHFLYHANLIVHEVNHQTVSKDWSSLSFPYAHNRLYYITKGEAKIVLTDRCIYLRKGYLYLLPAFMMVETICETSFHHHYVHFQINSLEFSTYLSYYLPNFYVQCNRPDYILTLFKNLADHFEKPSLSNTLSTQGSIQLLLAPFFDNVISGDNQIQRFIPALEYIDAHINGVIELRDLAKLMNLDQVYFSNLFTKTFQVSPRQYINKRRLNQAQLLLTNTNKKIKKIALEVGFENDMYFSRLFKAKIGMTPGTYRRS